MRDVILTDRGPKPIGPYSQAFERMDFCTFPGRWHWIRKTGRDEGHDVREQTERVFENVKEFWKPAGSNLHHIVKTTVFLKDMNDFTAMNESVRESILPRAAGALDRAGGAPARKTRWWRSKSSPRSKSIFIFLWPIGAPSRQAIFEMRRSPQCAAT